MPDKANTLWFGAHRRRMGLSREEPVRRFFVRRISVLAARRPAESYVFVM